MNKSILNAHSHYDKLNVSYICLYFNMTTNANCFIRFIFYEYYKINLHHVGEITGNAGNDWFFDKMSNLGFEHTGFHKGFDPVLQIRYHSVLDLKDKTADDIIKNMDGLRKRNTKK
ncbi:peptidoglycan bridge formation glycyltransferase FemA/FemB family protein, partial [Staphylococcus aureus]|uniref:peptidoglycan bridge formation glycyltransferase FemA/FemB family protein n=1 Tax=Staphylococcus aureus TaxID=1280 RepID=UPI00356451F0